MSVWAGTANSAPFGTLADGRPVEAITLDNGQGMRAVVLSYGAVLQALEVPDRAGKSIDVVLGYRDLAGYVDHPQYFGATVGRYANRIAGGKFSIDGRAYQLPLNDKTNSLHGGTVGFDKRLWTIEALHSGARSSVTLALTSPDGDQGYPGTMTVKATYTLDDQGALTVDYQATSDRATIVNLTNHSFFNLAGEASGETVERQILAIPADAITPVDAHLIPTGALMPVAGTPFDFRRPTAIGLRLRQGNDAQIRLGQGYDHNFVVSSGPTKMPRLMARLEDPASGRVLEILSNQPGIQFYSGNFLDGSVVGKAGHGYRQTDGLALEPQVFPNTPNTPGFGSALLRPGATYRNTIVYRFSTSRPGDPAL